MVVTPAVPVALYEGPGPEVPQAGAGRVEALAGALGSCVRVHQEAVALPHVVPVFWAVRNVHVLGMHSHGLGGSLAHRTLGNVLLHIRTLDRGHHHGHGLGGAQPVTVVIPAGVITHVVEVTEEVGHGGELP